MRLNLQAVVWSVGALVACQASPPEPAASPPAPIPAASAVATPTATPVGATGATAPAASTTPAASPSPTRASFDDDVAFLSQHGAAVKVLQSANGGRIAVTGKYQARVMTSAVELGPDGASLGFVNRSFIQAGKTGTAFDNYGGEDRFWLGPEGGQYALYFRPGEPYRSEVSTSSRAARPRPRSRQEPSSSTSTRRSTSPVRAARSRRLPSRCSV